MRNQVHLSFRHGLAPTAGLVRDHLADALVADAEVREAATLEPDGGFPLTFHRALRQVCAALVVLDGARVGAADGHDGSPGGHDLWLPTEVALCLAARPDVRVVPLWVGDAVASRDGEAPPGGPLWSMVLDALRREDVHRLRVDHLDEDLAPIVRLVQQLVHQVLTIVPPLPDDLVAANEADELDDRLPLDDDPLLERCLVEAARVDAEAFAALYRHHLPAVRAATYRRTRSREIAEEVTAATFEEAYHHLDRFRPDDGARLGTWLLEIASTQLTRRRP